MAAKRLSSASLAVIAALLLLATFGWLWWNYVYSNPQRVFRAMLDNSLRVSSVTKEVSSNSEGQALNQTARLQFGAEDRVMSRVELKQTDGSNTTIKTESVGTPTAEYTRYTQIDTDQKQTNGQPLDFSRLIGTWGRGATDTEGKLTAAELYNEMALGIIPLGNLGKADRRELLNLMRSENVYEVDYASAQKTTINGRPAYKYSITVETVAYARMLKRLAEMRGLTHLKDLDPADYAGGERLPFNVAVDIGSHQLRQIEYADLSRTENFSGYNGRYQIDLPAESIPIEELQARLQELQQ